MLLSKIRALNPGQFLIVVPAAIVFAKVLLGSVLHGQFVQEHRASLDHPGHPECGGGPGRFLFAWQEYRSGIEQVPQRSPALT
jgi:hypothetical protein